jgi:hypothetical protein
VTVNNNVPIRAATLVCLLGLLELPASRATTTTSACVYAGWTQPEGIKNTSNRGLEFTAVAERATVGYIVSVPYLLSESDSSGLTNAGVTTLNVQTLSGQDIGSPSEGLIFSFPHAAIDANGDLHVLWGEPDSAPRKWSVRGRNEIPITSVWHSVWRHGKWSPPELIYHAQAISWNPIATSRLTADANGGLRIGFTALDESQGQQGIVNLAYTAGRWYVRKLQNETPIVYTDLAVGPRNDVALAFVAGPSPRTGVAWRQNGLFVRTSADGGAHWSEAVSVAADYQTPAFEPHIFYDARGGIDLVWTQNITGSDGGATMWHASSHNGGLTWGNATALPTHHAVSRTQAIVDPCGSIHVALQIPTQQGPRLGYMRASPGAWTPLQILFADQVGAQPTLWLAANGRPKLLFYQGPAGQDAFKLMRLKLTHLLER